ncbi:TIGR03936 family radical SAM-associated protein [uncultured Aeromicrobium sp.]|uniref:TIGR03936 family radical SAM-associated protein n=1 Tax=uncultured Aeromicrobium sp. TaxID=337820 RepID=UPI0025FF65AB|nr:TIGR03936 family radical SAM-associated protein [uncultured Aeromicrobium sp.]
MSNDGSRTLEGTLNPEAPNPQLPIVQKLRVRYAKRGRLRFTSHRDFGRAFERAIRRAALPIGYSSGFTPHPKISYAGASPTGAASEAEYLEIGLTREMEPAVVRERLDEALPKGLDILDVVVATPGALADRLEASHWRIRVPGLPLETVRRAVSAFERQDEILVERMMKRGPRTFDVRASVVSLRAEPDPDEAACAILDLVVRHGTPSVRPDDVLVGLRSAGGLATGQTPVATRLAQGPLDPETGTVGDPLAHDRDAS